MQRLLFHNPHDRNSIDFISLYIGLSDVDIINPTYDKSNIPDGITISTLPYLIDRQIVLTSSPPYLTPTITLQFECRDYQDNLLINEDKTFLLDIQNICTYNIQPENGIIIIELNCPIPKTLHLRLEADGYYPWESDIEVINSA